MSEKNQSRSWLFIVLALLVVVPVGWFVISRLEGRAPEVNIQPDVSFLGESQTLQVKVADPKSGIKKIQVDLIKDGKTSAVYTRTFPSLGFGQAGTVENTSFEMLIEPKKMGISDGNAILRLEVSDYSWRRWWHGNRQLIEKSVMVDTKPPQTEVLTRLHYINLGGAGLVIYKISEPCPNTGVMVGDNFYPGFSGHFKNPDICLAFFAVPYDQTTKTKIFIQSTDPAGNTAKAGFYYGIRNKIFKKEDINISDNFLDAKMPEFDIAGVADSAMTPLEKFIYINKTVRKANYDEITGLGKVSGKKIYWDLKKFLRFPNSARKANFADARSYYYKGKMIDEQVHLGIDLASLQHAAVPAGNSGKVVFTGSEGIYGNTVVIDHGFGVLSMYCHLNQIDVTLGEEVLGGGIIGRTGTTGLAAGDHLHFSMLVHDTFVNPEEWWDEKWIEDNVTSKISSVKSEWEK